MFTAHRIALNPKSEVAAPTLAGSTGHWPVPSGDPPLGTGKACECLPASLAMAGFLPQCKRHRAVRFKRNLLKHLSRLSNTEGERLRLHANTP